MFQIDIDTNSNKRANKLDNCNQVQQDNPPRSFHFGLQLRLLPAEMLSENDRSEVNTGPLLTLTGKFQNDKNATVPWYQRSKVMTYYFL